MKKSIIYLSIILLTSCSTTSYVHDLESTPFGIDYREGKWLLNEIEAPLSIKEKLTKIAFDGFSNKLGNTLKKAENATSFSLSYVPIMADTLLLKQIKKESKFDFLINIKCSSSKNEIGSLEIGKIYSKKRNVAEAVLEVYDLNTLELIYFRKVTGKVTIKDNDNGFTFAKSANGIMVSSLKRIMKEID